MNTRKPLVILLAALTLLGLPACRQDAGRPDRRTTATSRATPDPAPAARDDQAAAIPAPAVATPPPASEHTIRPDILMVNGDVITVAEVLYPLRDRLTAARRSMPADQFRRVATRWVADATQQEVGALLLSNRALSLLEENQQAAVDQFVAQEVDNIVARDFAGSQARLDHHLARYGLSRDQYLASLKRTILAQHYAREEYRPRVHVRRAELIALYEEKRPALTTPGGRELQLIAVPFAEMLPDGTSWQRATDQQRAAARAAARTRIAAAYNALDHRPFAEVAREYSFGPLADHGGDWGMIGKPLQPPLDTASSHVFEMQEGQVSEPIESDDGCYIVRCGRVQPQHTVPFSEIQDDLRDEIVDERINALSTRAMMDLVRKASISPLEPFVDTAVSRAADPTTWPQPE